MKRGGNRQFFKDHVCPLPPPPRMGYKQMSSILAGWPIAPSYMSPNAGGGRGELRGLSQWVQLWTWSPNKLRRSNSAFNLCLVKNVQTVGYLLYKRWWYIFFLLCGEIFYLFLGTHILKWRWICEDTKMMWTCWVLEREWYISKDNWRIFDLDAL